ncbi:DNA-binding LacI/PurR family transcriptional regulator [Pseudoxanthomonas japonensis]|uniref:LacI family DNA-binding transcriptional regulator n=1 Tax=Pseudoxanthomonas japonensis TaxID=69284 RepID=UPI00285F32E3|nr:LacI family DNA-binding transcriptional regulator [Pseudoxanthomonas japonensis]MDR7070026.1 DNA-binding LacI/PurR family transcriptional regulator [Pseudoxanthomonas japonensis]
MPPAKRKPRSKRAVKDLPAPGGHLTMADLAKVVGVSAITVSRALRDSPLVNAETRERVRQVAQQYGYAFNVSARNLKLRRSMTVAVVVEMKPTVERQMSGPYPLDLLGGITQELTSTGYSVLLTSLQGGSLPNVQAADGVILLGQGAHEDAMHEVQRWGRPMVVWGAVSRHESQVVVGSDNRRGGALAAERFIALGRRRPAFLGDPAHGEFAERLEGFAAALTRHGIAPLTPTVASFTVGAGAEAVHALLEANPQVDALFAASDLLAIGAIRALIERGRRVPEDVSVIGYDDTPLGATYVPPLTSVHQNFIDAGVLLARKVRALIEGETAASETLSTHLVVRAT